MSSYAVWFDFSWERCVPVKSHRQLVEAYGTLVVSRREVCLWCGGLDNGNIIVDNKQQNRRQNMSTTDDNVRGADALTGEDRLRRLTSSESRIFHWVVPVRCPRSAGLQKSLHTLGFKIIQRQSRRSLCVILSSECDVFTPLKEFSFCTALLRLWITGWSRTPETKQGIYDLRKIPTANNYSETAQVKETMATVFWCHTDYYCCTLKILRQPTIRRKRSGLLR